MCTLTIYKGKKRCVVTMNRDELRTRKEAGLLYSRSSGDVRLFYPVDASSGGTWFGVNNRGVVLCLLNRYQAPEVVNPVSRGEIIPRALEQGDFAAIDAWLQHLDYSQYNPFDLFLVRKKKVRHFSWDGETCLEEEVEFKNWYIFSSSSINTEEVLAYRQNIFQAWNREMGNQLSDASEILRGFHLIQVDGMESLSVLMEREKSHSKSVIQADIGSKELELKYIPDVLEKSLDAPLNDAQIEKIVVNKRE